MAGVGQCASLKVRKCASKTECTGLRKLVVPGRLRRGCGAGLRGTLGIAFLCNFCVHSYIGGSKA